MCVRMLAYACTCVRGCACVRMCEWVRFCCIIVVCVFVVYVAFFLVGTAVIGTMARGCVRGYVCGRDVVLCCVGVDEEVAENVCCEFV